MRNFDEDEHRRHESDAPAARRPSDTAEDRHGTPDRRGTLDRRNTPERRNTAVVQGAW